MCFGPGLGFVSPGWPAANVLLDDTADPPEPPASTRLHYLTSAAFLSPERSPAVGATNVNDESGGGRSPLSTRPPSPLPP